MRLHPSKFGLLGPYFVLVTAFVINQIELSTSESLHDQNWLPCPEFPHVGVFSRCLCSSVSTNESLIKVDCDHVVFSQDFPIFHPKLPITYFSHKHVNHQSLPPQVFMPGKIPLETLDLSYNWIRRLTDKSLEGLTETLESLDLSHNLLGDQLNPIFSTLEFNRLPRLKTLKLGFNHLIDLDSGIIEGAFSLQELHLDNNEIKSVPTSSLRGPNALKILDLSVNQLGKLGSGDFSGHQSLMMLNVSRNKILNIQTNTFKGMKNLKVIDLSWNRLQRLDSDTLQGLSGLEALDLSYNYLTEVPTSALSSTISLRALRLAGNLIQSLDERDTKNIGTLELLDLSRNRITEIPLDFFRGMRRLRELNLGINQLRTIPAEVFRDLSNLQYLNLQDNNILAFPSEVFNSLGSLSSLILDYNRISALVPVQSNNITHLSLSNNLIREIPPTTFFVSFPNLSKLNIHGNLIGDVEEVVFPPQLKELNLGWNNLQKVPRFQLQQLQVLKLHHNSLAALVEHNFVLLGSLNELDLSSNSITTLFPNTFDGLEKLKNLDLSRNKIELMPPTKSLTSLRTFNMSKNAIKQFENLDNMEQLQDLDLSYNLLTNLKQDVFVNSSNLKSIDLRGNKLSSFRGFSGDFSNLKSLDLSNNQISYVYPHSFENFVSLWNLDLHRNQFFTFPTEFLKNCKELREISLARNQIKNLNEMNFVSFPVLRKIDLSHNLLEFILEKRFDNTSQLQFLDLSSNKLETIDDTIFQGLLRLELDLSNNYLSTLPPALFDRVRVQKLQRVDLSKNTFKSIPFEALQMQYFFLENIDLSDNQITRVPQNLNNLVNVKTLDLSKNPIEEDSLENLLSEPKTVRHLSLAQVGLKRLSMLEMPFLRSLNLSGNSLSGFSEDVFKRTTSLTTLAMDHNQLVTLGSKFPSSLTHLDLSGNPLEGLNGSALSPNLQSLRLVDMKKILRLDKASLLLKDLVTLEMYNLPKLGYLDIRGLLTNLQYLEHFDFEVKDHHIVDQIHPGINSRVNYIGLRGRRIQSISTGAFAGLTSANVKICLVNTSLTALPSILVPVPMSSNIVLDLTGSMITNFSPPFLSHNIVLAGLRPSCDCNSIPLVKYLQNVGNDAVCSTPNKMAGSSVLDIKISELACDHTASAAFLPPPFFAAPKDIPAGTGTGTGASAGAGAGARDDSNIQDIIWSLPPPKAPKISKSMSSKQSNNSLSSAGMVPPDKIYNMDTLIIGIVGGVVGIIVFFVFMIICFVKMSNHNNRSDSSPYHASAAPQVYGPPQGFMPGSKCTCPMNMHMMGGKMGDSGSYACVDKSGNPIHAVCCSPPSMHSLPPGGTLNPHYMGGMQHGHYLYSDMQDDSRMSMA